MADGIYGSVDTSQLEAALTEYEIATGKDMVEVINRAGRNVAFRAIQFTPKADKSKIDALRQQVSTEVFGASGKRLKRTKKAFAATDRALLIYLKGLWSHGKNPRSVSSRAELAASALRMVTRRLQAIGFLRSGWFTAAEAFAKATGLSWSKGGAKQFGSPKGSVEVANESQPEAAASLSNNIFATSHDHALALEKYGTQALQDAVTFVANDMKNYAENKIAQTAKRFTG